MTKGFTNHNTHDMQFINCPKYKMHICVEQTDIGELIFGSDVPRYEIVSVSYTHLTLPTSDLV